MSDQGEMWRLAGLVGHVALEMGVAIGLSLWAGQWVDSRIETAPWGMAVGLVLGLGAAVLCAWRSLRHLN